MTEALAMPFEERRQHLGVWRVAESDHLPITNETMFDFGIVDLVSELGFMRLWLASPDNLGVRFPQAGDLLLGGNAFALEHPPGRLVDDTLHQGADLTQLQDQVLGGGVVLLLAQYCGCLG